MNNIIKDYCKTISKEIVQIKFLNEEVIFPLIKVNVILCLKEILKTKIEENDLKLKQVKIRLFGINKEGGDSTLLQNQSSKIRKEIKASVNLFAELENEYCFLELKKYLKENHQDILMSFYEKHNKDRVDPNYDKDSLKLYRG